jgi:hypothetical protein
MLTTKPRPSKRAASFFIAPSIFLTPATSCQGLPASASQVHHESIREAELETRG